MGYSKKVYREAGRVLAERRQRANEEAASHLQKAYERLPRLRQIDRQMSASGAQVIQAVLRGEKEMAALMQRLKEENLSLQEERKALLASAGWPEDYTQEAWSCPKCRDSGYLEDHQRCSCYDSLLQQIASRQLSSGWDEEEYTFENFGHRYRKRLHFVEFAARVFKRDWYRHRPQFRGYKSSKFQSRKIKN